MRQAACSHPQGKAFPVQALDSGSKQRFSFGGWLSVHSSQTRAGPALWPDCGAECRERCQGPSALTNPSSLLREAQHLHL